MAKRSYEINMTEGPVLANVIRFALPLAATSILQLLYNAADVMVVGQFAEHSTEAVAAVSSTGSLINLIINLLMGMSVGTNVAVAKGYGARDNKAVSNAVHTSLLFSLLGGAVVSVFGFVAARKLLTLMGSPADVIDGATLYIRIYFCGMIFNAFYNFGASILRAVGDTKRPLYFLAFSGAVNVVLNLFFVVVCKMAAGGVALATVISQAISAILVCICLMRSDSAIRFFPNKLRFEKKALSQIVKVGFPAGLQGSLFSISNVLIQSSVNSFLSEAMAGNGAASSLCDFIYVAMNALYQTSISFTGQNVGAKRFDRIRRITLTTQAVVTVAGFAMGMLIYMFAKPLLHLYLKDPTPKVMETAMTRLGVFCFTYFLCGNMDTMVGSLRGMGASIVPMITSLCGACGFRILWIYTIFQKYHTLSVLYWSYPVSWLITTVVHLICYFIIKKNLIKREGVLQ